MKGILEEHVKAQGKIDLTEENKESETKRLVQGKYMIISETILPILQKLHIDMVSFSNAINNY